MSVIVGEQKIAGKAPYYKRKIQCPAHYLIPPNIDIYKREPVPEMKYVNKGVIQHYKIKTMRRAKDAFGRPIMDWKKLYELRRKGLVLQPFISASFAIESVYDPLSPICQVCQGKCKEGKERVVESTIKRLTGSYR